MASKSEVKVGLPPNPPFMFGHGGFFAHPDQRTPKYEWPVTRVATPGRITVRWKLKHHLRHLNVHLLQLFFIHITILINHI
jgi:hypothetical protein